MSKLSPAEARSKILALIGESVSQALGLKETLLEEQSALEEQDMEALDAIVASKTASVEALQALEQRREQLCRQWGFASGPHQMTALIEWCDAEKLISGRWEQLLAIAAEGDALNMTNGAIIRVRQQHFESSLSVLRGVLPGSDTYGRDGGEHGDFGRRSLAEA